MRTLPGLVLTSEHARRGVPARYAELFRGHARVLRTHRAYDLGALELAQVLRRRLGAPLLTGKLTRLLIDLNRSVGHPRLFSEFSRDLSEPERRRLIERVHQPHWQRARELVAQAAAAGPVLHLAVHSFTPVLDGQVRSAELGLLYDPAQPLELELCTRLQAELERTAPGLRVRRNYPYRGISDGLTTALRREYDARRYAGVEIEMNQALLKRSERVTNLGAALAEAVARAWLRL